MNLPGKYTGAIGATLIISIFILLKLPDLSTPYHWDELGLYARSALAMKDSGHISILPSALDPAHSLGHPLLCFAAYAAFFRMFGDSCTVGHTLSLIFACVTLIFCYRLARSALDVFTALIATALLAAQPCFFSISAIIIPETMLMCFSMIALWALMERKMWTYLLATIACVLTKESGLAVPLATGFFLLVQSAYERRLFARRTVGWLLITLVPFICFGIFLLAQKRVNGWYLYPYHKGLLTTNLHLIGKRAFWISGIVFRWQGRWLLSLFAVAGLVIRLRQRPVKTQPLNTLLACLVMIGSAIAFSVPFPGLDRYVLYLMPFIVIPGAAGITALADVIVKSRRHWIAIILAGGSGIYNLTFLKPEAFNDCTDMAYKNFVNCTKTCINWAEQQPWKDSTVTVNWPLNIALEDARFGYLQNHAGKWPNVNLTTPAQQTKYGIYFHSAGNGVPFWQTVKGFRVLKSFRRNDVVFSVVERE